VEGIDSGEAVMFSLVRTHLINAVKSIKRLFPVSKKQKETANPWEADLVRLAAERRDQEVVVEAPSDEVTQFVNELAKAISKETPQVPELKKTKRRSDPTVTDLKAWWGESVATWDPDTDANNVTSADQRNRLRPATWLQKGPSQFDK
jgi:hypothetical protein